MRVLDFNGEINIPGGLDQERVVVLAKALRANHSLTSVGLLGCKLDGATIEMLLKLKEEKPNLVSLCGLTPDQTEASFGGWGLTIQEVKHFLAPEIAVHRSLTKLDLNRNCIGDEGAKALAEALRVNHMVTELDLRENENIGAAGKEALREAVKGRAGFELKL